MTDWVIRLNFLPITSLSMMAQDICSTVFTHRKARL